MAAEYRKSAKTFSRLVRSQGVPHDLVGRSMMFDPVKVATYMEALGAAKLEADKVIPFRLPVRRKRFRVVDTVKSKFSEAI